MQPPTEVVLWQQSFRRDSDADSLGNGKEAHRMFSDSAQHSDSEAGASSSGRAGGGSSNGKEAAGQQSPAAQHAEDDGDSRSLPEGCGDHSILVTSQPAPQNVGSESHADLEVSR
jgi:hypothetical protein